MAAFTTYSFLDCQATLTGPNVTVTIGSTSGTAEEGISIAFAEDQASTMIGADGTGMHSIHAGQSGTVIVRLLKSSPTNAVLSAAYQADRQVPSSGGQNTIVVSWLAGGHLYTCVQCVFVKFPDQSYAKDAALLEWGFRAIRITPNLGTNPQTTL